MRPSAGVGLVGRFIFQLRKSLVDIGPDLLQCSMFDLAEAAKIKGCPRELDQIVMRPNPHSRNKQINELLEPADQLALHAALDRVAERIENRTAQMP